MQEDGMLRIEQTIPEAYQELVAVQADAEQELLARENVVGVALGTKWTKGRDTGKKAITVLVESKMDEELLSPDQIVPAKLKGGTITDVQTVGTIFAGPAIAEPAVAARLEGLAAPNGAGTIAAPAELVRPQEEIAPFALTGRVRPLIGGFSVGHFAITAGTIATGCYDWDAMPDVPTRYYILSNNHVLANSNAASLGDPIRQPGPFDGGTPLDTVAQLSRFVPIKWITPSSAPLNYVDAAVAEADFSKLSREIFWIGYVKRLYAAPRVGDIVQKTGRTTHFTTGRITNINATIDVNYGGGRVARFAKQILARTASGRAMGAPGDSGSLVMNLDEEGVGLLFAGSALVTVINHLHFVQALLRVRITEK
jgi:hypothetical protein